MEENHADNPNAPKGFDSTTHRKRLYEDRGVMQLWELTLWFCWT